MLGRSGSGSSEPASATAADDPAADAERAATSSGNGDARSVTAEHASAIVEGRVPNVVSAAWELELLIAGAITFALFQLPDALSALRDRLGPHVSGAGEFAMYMGYLYSKAIVYALIAAFVTNLTARAYWVGLVGLHSVYPRGVRWDQLGMGPVSQEVYRSRISSLPTVMSRVDNFASVIFSFGFLIVAAFLFTVLGLAVLGGAAYLLSNAFFGGKHTSRFVYGIMITFLVCMAAVGLTDKYRGRRLDPAGRGHRWLRRAVTVVSRASGMAFFAPILFTLMSNVGRYRMMLLFYVAIFGSLAVGLLDFFASLGVLRSGSPRYVPEEADVRGVDAQHYESLRKPSALSMAPTIQSDVVSGPYVRLFIPYNGARHDEALATGCPGLQPMRSGRPHLAPLWAASANDTLAADRALGCLRRIHALALDGVPRPEVPLRFHVHPITGRDGLIAYIPTEGLAGGMHTLSVLPPPRTARSDRRGQPLQPYEIVFWK